MRRLVLAAASGLVSCAPARPCPAVPPAAAPVAAPPSAASPAKAAPERSEEREKVAVLPFEDDELFRDERRALREQLAASLVRALPDHDVVPLAEVDAKSRPVSRKGTRCAYDGVPLARRVSGQGWLTTNLVHVMGFKDQPEQLWVELSDWQSVRETLGGTWDPKLERIARYRRAFSTLALLPDAGALGGLGGRFVPKGEVTVGELTLCVRHGFRNCVPETKAFSDRAPAMSACFAGVDEETRYLLFEGARRCEIESLDDTTGLDGRREACLCAALRQSAGASASHGRWRLALHYEAKDIVGNPQPEIRVLDASTNLHAEDDWHSMRRVVKGKKTYSSVRRLVVDNVDAARPALARCGLAAGSLLIAELSISEAGAVTEARVRSGAKRKQDAACIEKALKRGAYACTNDGKPAKLRLSLEWPKAQPGS